jgi:hypothetical protein
VFQSTRRLYATLHWYWYLQEPDEGSFDERILSRYAALHQAYFDDLPRIDRRIHEIAFAELEADPEGTLRGVYETLELGPFEPMEAPLRARLAELAPYQRNVYAPMEEELRTRVANRWGPVFQRWGYS